MRWRIVCALALAVLVAAEAPARADGRLYGRLGVRMLFGLDPVGSPMAALGYRRTRGPWGVDLSAASLQAGDSSWLQSAGGIAGCHHLGAPNGVDLWAVAGLGYGWVRVWTDYELSKRSGTGVHLELALTADLASRGSVDVFARLGLMAPFYALYDIYESRESAQHIVAVDLSLGVGF